MKLIENPVPFYKLGSSPEHAQSLSQATSDFIADHIKVIKAYVRCMMSDTDCKELVTESTTDYSYNSVV